MSALINEDYRNFTMHSAKIFPTQAKCLYNNFGPSGSTQEKDALCFLPQNTVNEKIFVFFYVWFIFVFIAQLLNCIYITLLMISKYLRKYDLRNMCDRSYSFRYNEFLSTYSHHGLWFSLRILHNNLSPVLFQDLIKDLMKPENAKKDSTSGDRDGKSERDFVQTAA